MHKGLGVNPSKVVGGPEQEPGALGGGLFSVDILILASAVIRGSAAGSNLPSCLSHATGYGRSGTWDQISPHSESPNLTISRRSSYAASSTDEAHSQGCVAQQQQTAHAYVAQSQLTEQQEYKRPPATVRSQPQLAGPRAYLMRSVSAGHRSSSRPVCTREAPSMGCVAQQSSPRSAGSVGSGSASRRASYVAGCVFEAGATTQGRPAMPTMQDQLKALLSQNCGAPGVSMPSSQVGPDTSVRRFTKPFGVFMPSSQVGPAVEMPLSQVVVASE
eukprot:1156905-Pelagomonas_calceolata.AAC.3